MSFTRKEGSDDTRDVVAQHAVNLPFMTQSRSVAGGVLTTDKTSDGVGGSWTRVTLEPDDPPELPETRYIFSTVISASKIRDESRTAWLLKKTGTSIYDLNNQRVEVVRLLPFGSAKRPRQRTLTFEEVVDTSLGLTGLNYLLRFALTSSVRGALGDRQYQRIVSGIPTSILTQYMSISPRASSTSQYNLAIVFQPFAAGAREEGTVEGSAESLASGFERGGRSFFGIPFIRYAVQPGTQTIHVGLQQLRYIRASIGSNTNTQVETLSDVLMFQAPRGVYYGDPMVVRVSKSRLIAVAVGVANNTIVQTGGTLTPEIVSSRSVGPALAFVSNDDGLTWQSAPVPAWGMENFWVHQNFTDYKYPDDYSRIDSPFQTQQLTAMTVWSKTHAIGMSVFYNSANSSAGGEYRLFLMDGVNPLQYVAVPVPAYQYVLLHACRPVGAAVFTLRARADAVYPFYADGIYPELEDVDGNFQGLSVAGYADRSAIVVYDGDTVTIRTLPWSRLYANSEVFCLGGSEIGTVVFNTDPSAGSPSYWVFSSKDFGATWAEKFTVDALSDPPSFDTHAPAHVTQKAVVYTNDPDAGVSSRPPRIVFPELVEGQKIPPHPGATWLNT